MTLTQIMPPSTAPRPDTPTPWRQIADKPVGGFLKCPTDWLLLPWGLYRAGRLDFFGLRTWCGLLELPERRCDRPPDKDVHYSIKELARLLDVARRAPVQTAVRSLEELGLVAWSMSSIAYLPTPAAVQPYRTLPGYQALQVQLSPWRPWVPVPRRLVRWLAREGNPGLWATAAGVLLRCLWSKQRQCVSGGRVAAAWIAEGFGLAKRTVQRRLDGLQACGWLERFRSTDAADARLAQRHGARTVVNLQWDAPGDCEPEDTDEAPAPPQKARKETSRPARQEVTVEHFVKHPVTRDQNLSPLAPVCDQNLSPLPDPNVPETPGKSTCCPPSSGTDLYPLQEQRQTPDPLPALSAPALPTRVCEKTPTGVCQNTSEANKHPNTKVAASPVVTPPPSAPPASLEDAAAVFTALPSAEQDTLLQAATARLLTRGVSTALLIRPVVFAEVYAHLTPSSLATTPGKAPRATLVSAPVNATPSSSPAVHVPSRQAPPAQAAVPGRPAALVDPAAVFAALPQAEQDALLAEVTARLLAQGMRKDLLIRPLLLAEVYAHLAPASSSAMPNSARREASAPARPSRAGDPPPAKVPSAGAEPDLRDVVPADLRDVTRLEALREQAIRRGWLTGCEADRLRFVAAAVHARRMGAAPCRLFVALVRDQRWVVITAGDEDEARALLRQRDPRLMRASATPPRGLSEDARFVRGVQQILRQEGWQGDPFVAIAAKYPDWTRARWDAARAELRAPSGGRAMGRLGMVLGAEE